jgi:hypothetical protein
MKCWKIRNAQGSRLIIVVALPIGRSSENICSNSGGAKRKRKDRVKLSVNIKTEVSPHP